jgi:hypothetical protein
MKEFTIGAIVGFLLIGYGIYTFYIRGHMSGLLFALAGAAVIFIANRLSGKFFQQPVPKKVVERILDLVEAAAESDGPLTIVPYGSRGLEQFSDDAMNLAFLASKIRREHPNVGLALSERHQIVFVNPEAVRTVIRRKGTRLMVNDW